jgi:hypothetical protein
MSLLLSGAILVTVSMPCRVGRWPTLAFGVLGAGNTCLFRGSASTSEDSMRLFFAWLLKALKQALSDTDTSIAIGMIAHLAGLTHHQRSTRGIALLRLAGMVAHDQAMAAMALSTGVARIDAGGDDLLLPGLILAVPEDAALHPVGAFAVAPARILPFLRGEIAQVFKYQDARSMLGCELDNACTHQVGKSLITVADLAPEGSIILLVFRQDTSLATVACDPSKLSRALCPLSLRPRQ